MIFAGNMGGGIGEVRHADGMARGRRELRITVQILGMRPPMR